MLNSRDISLLRPDVSANCTIFLNLCSMAGLDVLITSTVRDDEYQEYLYQQGRTRPGQIVTNGRRPTFHWSEAGLAFDFCKNVKGHEYDDADFFKKAGAIAKQMGFSWGGDWTSFPDMPHIQWDDNGRYSSTDVRNKKFPPTMPRYTRTSYTKRDNRVKVVQKKLVAKYDFWPNPTGIWNQSNKMAMVRALHKELDVDSALPSKVVMWTKPMVEKWVSLGDGSRGDLVLLVQCLLMVKGYELELDGSFGPATARRVRQFQQKNKLAVTGIVDVSTMTKLLA